MTKIFVLPILAPYKIPLLVLVANYCFTNTKSKTDVEVLTFLVRHIQQDVFLDNDPVKINPTITELLEQLGSAISDCEGHTKVCQLVLNSVWQMQNLNAVYQLFSKLKFLLVDSPTEAAKLLQEQRSKKVQCWKALTKRSFLGSFVLNCVKDFEALEFYQLSHFWTAFVQYREESRITYKQMCKNGTSAVDSDPNDAFGHKMGSWEDKTLAATGSERLVGLASYDLSKALAKQIRLSENYGSEHSQSLKEILSLVAQNGTYTNFLPQINYLKYLECVNNKDYVGSFKFLHAYFDYMLSNSCQNYYQFALLTLATLHAKFNSDTHTLEAIKEAVLVARETKDNNCLNYLLAWIYNFLRNRPHLQHDFFENNRKLIEFLEKKTRAVAAEPTSAATGVDLSARAYQIYCTQGLIDGFPLTKLHESLIKADYLALNDNLYGNGVQNTDLDQNWSCSSFILNSLLKAHVWSRVGQTTMCNLWCDVALRVSELRHDDVNKIEANWRRAYVLFASGDVDGCFATLRGSTSQIRDNSTILHIFDLKLAVNELRTRDARQLLQKLQSDAVEELDLKYEIILLQVEFELQLGNQNSAAKLLSDNIAFLEKEPRVYNNYWYITFYTRYISIFVDVTRDTGVEFLPSIHKLLRLSEKSSLYSLTLQLILLLSKILAKRGFIDKAYRLLDMYVPYYIQFCDLAAQCDCYLSLATFALQNEENDIEAKNYIQLAQKGYTMLHNKARLEQCARLNRSQST